MRTLIPLELLEERVRNLGEDINWDYRGKTPIVLGILDGAFVFLSDLIRSTEIPMDVRFVKVSRYGMATSSTNQSTIVFGLGFVQGRDVLVVEDIVDTGITMSSVLEYLTAQNPASIRVCALLDKPSRRTVPVEIHYTGFEIPNQFVFGYGMDYKGLYRNLPNIMVQE